MQYVIRDGRNKGDITLYALSTCVWCRKTKKLLVDMGVQHKYIDVDRLSKAEQEKVRQELDGIDPDWRFPCLVMNGGRTCICGFKEQEIKEALDA